MPLHALMQTAEHSNLWQAVHNRVQLAPILHYLRGRLPPVRVQYWRTLHSMQSISPVFCPLAMQ